MPRRRANDNVVIAKEMVHMMSQKSRKRHKCAIKLDVQEAYDTVSWTFLASCLKNLGFSNDFVNMIMLCVSIVSYRVQVNGSFMDFITPARGLRQGDHLHVSLPLSCIWGSFQQISKETK